MAIFSSQLATLRVLMAQHAGTPGGAITGHHVPTALGTGMVIFIVMLAILIAAFVRVARELVALCGQLVKVLAAAASVMLAVALIAGVFAVLLIRH